VCRNWDVPGVIGRIGTILRTEGVNIATLRWDAERLSAECRKPVKALAVVAGRRTGSSRSFEALKVIEALLRGAAGEAADGKLKKQLLAHSRLYVVESCGVPVITGSRPTPVWVMRTQARFSGRKTAAPGVSLGWLVYH